MILLFEQGFVGQLFLFHVIWLGWLCWGWKIPGGFSWSRRKGWGLDGPLSLTSSRASLHEASFCGTIDFLLGGSGFRRGKVEAVRLLNARTLTFIPFYRSDKSQPTSDSKRGGNQWKEWKELLLAIFADNLPCSMLDTSDLRALMRTGNYSLVINYFPVLYRDFVEDFRNTILH